MGNGNDEKIAKELGMDALLTPHGEREHARQGVDHAGERQLLTPHGERELAMGLVWRSCVAIS